MTLDIERIAREAGFDVGSGSAGTWVAFEDYDCTDEVKALIALVAAECATIAQHTVCDTHLPTGVKIYGTAAAKAIREKFGA